MKQSYVKLLFTGIVSLILPVILFASGVPEAGILAGDEARGRIAFVDIQQVFDVHPEKPAAEEKLNTLAREMQAELEEKAKELSTEEQQQVLKDYQQDLSDREETLIQDILDDINEAIKEVAREKEVRVVLQKQNVVYGGYDLTSDVIDFIKTRQE